MWNDSGFVAPGRCGNDGHTSSFDVRASDAEADTDSDAARSMEFGPDSELQKKAAHDAPPLGLSGTVTP